ncbi:RNA polymerase sigma factor [Propionibacteriaceae bacterium Y1700]|uniref:RNA polymerase sigma factor n=1 Tax=Microlunatus sp. Y1700 TaxID=3418487 RepID=UPI003DA6FE39
MSTLTTHRLRWESDVVSHADDLLRELYDTHWVRMVRLAGLLLGSNDQAEEVTQDAYVGIFKRLGRFRSAEDAVGYLRTSVVNGTRSVLRHRTVVRNNQPLPDTAPDGPEELAVRRDTDTRVLAALRELPMRQREVLIMRYYSDASGPEIAEALGISVGAVKSHTHRGIAALRERLGYLVDPDDPTVVERTREGGAS